VVLAVFSTFAPGGAGFPFVTNAEEPVVTTAESSATDTTLPPATPTTTTLSPVDVPAADTILPQTASSLPPADEPTTDTTLPPEGPASPGLLAQAVDPLLEPLLDPFAAPAIGIVSSLTSYDDNDSSGTITSGDGLWFQFDVTNSGDVTLDNVGVVDDTFAIAVTCPVGALGSTESTTCTADAAHTVTVAEAAAGNVHNEATATGTDPDAATVTATDALDTAVQGPDYEWVPSDVGHRTWDPDPGIWTTGLPQGYTEGETAPFRVEIPTGSGEFLKFQACLELGSAPGPYGFTRIDPWNRSYQPSPPPNPGGLTGEVSGFNGSGLTIDSVVFLGTGRGLCAAEWQGWEVRFTMSQPTGHVVYGGRIAAPGEAIASGSTVPNGQGASQWTGTFDAGIGTDNAEVDKVVKRIPFKVSEVAVEPAAIIVEKQTSPDGDPTQFTFAGTPEGTISDGEQLSRSVEPGRYTATETVPAGWDLTSIVCDDGNSSGDVGSATATFNAEAGETVTCVFANTKHDPSIGIEKATNGVDADTPTGPSIPVGDPVSWTYTVTNTGNVTLIDVTVADDQGVTVTCPTDTLAPGESMTCTASGTAAVGQYTNLGTATGTPPAGDDVTDDDSSHYYGSEGGIDIEKATNGADADTPTGPEILVGDPVEWTYVVTNTGSVALTDIGVTDDQDVAVTCPSERLDLGESMTCTATGVAIAGQYANLATVTGLDPFETELVDSDPSHYFGVNSAIEIEKATNGQDADTPSGPSIPIGSTVTWTYLVTNTGHVALTGVMVADDKGATVTCPKTTLATGESMTCTASGVAVSGQYTNSGTVTGFDPAQTIVTDTDPSHYYGKPDLPVTGIDADRLASIGLILLTLGIIGVLATRRRRHDTN
jgi:hypothetical protein